MLSQSLLAPLRQRIALAELGAHETAILASAQPAVDLILDGASDGTRGESRFGGAPDLPVGMEWPRNQNGEALSFLAQINLSEIAPFDGNPLPPDGWLWVFVGSDESLGDIEHRLILRSGETKIAPATVPDEDDEEQWAEPDFLGMKPHHLRLRLRADVPHYATKAFDALATQIAPDQDEQSDVEIALSKLVPGPLDDKSAPYVGQLLGYASGLNADPSESAFLMREVPAEVGRDKTRRAALDWSGARNWVQLMKLESIITRDLNFCVWDAGFLSFIIHRDDLTTLDFERVYGCGESS